MIRSHLLTSIFSAANYAAEALQLVRDAPLDTLTETQLVLRLVIALESDVSAAAKIVVAEMDKRHFVGFEAFQATTGKMLVAAETNDALAFQEAFAAWQEGRKKYPGNWQDALLKADAFAPFLPEGFVLPAAPIPEHRLSAADRKMLRQPKAAIRRAVEENLGWLRDMGCAGTAAELAASYSLVSVNRHLREATVSSSQQAPDLTIAFDEKGQMLGSFISH
jgi:hypothetical protein